MYYLQLKLDYVLAISADALISVTRKSGFEGVSIYNILVSGLMYFLHFRCELYQQSPLLHRNV